VVEKPSHFNNSESPDIYSLMNSNGENSRVEVLVIDQSEAVCDSAPQSPGSGYNSNKTTDDEGDNEGELDEGFCDELCDEGFAHLLVPDDPSDSSMIPTATLLEDFDLGVDMFDSTEQTIPTSEPLKSPAFGQLSPAGPGSPYQLVATSSPIPVPPHDIHSQNDYNEYLNHSGSNSSGSPAYSQHSGGYMPSTTTDEDELAMLLCEDLTGGELNVITSTPSLSLPMSTCGQHTTAYSTMAMDFTSQPVSYTSSTFGSQVDPSFTTPTLTSVHMGQPSLMDLAEASQLAALTGDAGLLSMTTVGQLDTTPMISSSSADINFSSSMNSCLPLSGVASSVAAGAQVCSRSSQTQQNNGRLTRSLSPAPSHAHSPAASYHRQSHSPSPSPRTNQYSISSVGSSSSGACYFPPSPGECNSPSSSKSPGNGVSTDTFVEMPFYQFKKILDDPSVDPTKKEEVKSIRKRGKNKVAAKNCRQKKIEVVMGLQQEVDKMKEEKKRLDSKCKGLEREINSLKQRCSSFRSLAYSS
jgi:FtsZ-binding cell division protein ZapB